MDNNKERNNNNTNNNISLPSINALLESIPPEVRQQQPAPGSRSYSSSGYTSPQSYDHYAPPPPPPPPPSSQPHYRYDYHGYNTSQYSTTSHNNSSYPHMTYQQPQYKGYSNTNNNNNAAISSNEHYKYKTMYKELPTQMYNVHDHQQQQQQQPVQVTMPVVVEEPKKPLIRIPEGRLVEPTISKIKDLEYKIKFHKTKDMEVDREEMVLGKNVVEGWMQLCEFCGCFLTYFKQQFSMAYNDETRIISFVSSDEKVDINLIMYAIVSTDSTMYFRALLYDLLMPLVEFTGESANLVELLADSRQNDYRVFDSFGFVKFKYNLYTIGYALYSFLDENRNDLNDLLIELVDEKWNYESQDVLAELNADVRVEILRFLMQKLLETSELNSFIDYMFAYPEIRKTVKKDVSMILKLQKDLAIVQRDLQLLKVHLGEMQNKIDVANADGQDDSLLKQDYEVMDKAIQKKLAMEADLKLKIKEAEQSEEFDPEEHQMKIFFLQNQPIGHDRNQNGYWIFQTLRGVFVLRKSDGSWMRYATDSELSGLKETFYSKEETLIGDYINYWLSKPTKAHMVLCKDDDEDSIFKVETGEMFLGNALDLIRSTALKIVELSLMPAFNEPSNKRYKHFLRGPGRLRLSSLVDQSTFETMRESVLQIFECYGVTESLKKVKKPKNPRSTKFDYTIYPPILFCFSDHEIEQVRVTDLRTIENALVEWYTLLTDSLDVDSFAFLLLIMLQTILENVQNESVYSLNKKFSDWLSLTMADGDDHVDQGEEDESINTPTSSTSAITKRSSARLKSSSS